MFTSVKIVRAGGATAVAETVTGAVTPVVTVNVYAPSARPSRGVNVNPPVKLVIPDVGTTTAPGGPVTVTASFLTPAPVASVNRSTTGDSA